MLDTKMADVEREITLKKLKIAELEREERSHRAKLEKLSVRKEEAQSRVEQYEAEEASIKKLSDRAAELYDSLGYSPYVDWPQGILQKWIRQLDFFDKELKRLAEENEALRKELKEDE